MERKGSRSRIGYLAVIGVLLLCGLWLVTVKVQAATVEFTANVGLASNPDKRLTTLGNEDSFTFKADSTASVKWSHVESFGIFQGTDPNSAAILNVTPKVENGQLIVENFQLLEPKADWSGYDPLTPGTYRFVAWQSNGSGGEDVFISQEYTVVSGSSETKNLTGIAITNPPTKTAYAEGDFFDPTGMVVTATYDDGTTAAVTGYTVQPAGALSTSDKQVTVSFTLGAVTKTATQTIKVSPRKAEYTELTMTSPPTKTDYFDGQRFDPAGLVLTAKFSDGTTETVTGYKTDPAGWFKSGDTKITFSYTVGDVTHTASCPVKVSYAHASAIVPESVDLSALGNNYTLCLQKKGESSETRVAPIYGEHNIDLSAFLKDGVTYSGIAIKYNFDKDGPETTLAEFKGDFTSKTYDPIQLTATTPFKKVDGITLKDEEGDVVPENLYTYELVSQDHSGATILQQQFPGPIPYGTYQVKITKTADNNTEKLYNFSVFNATVSVGDDSPGTLEASSSVPLYKQNLTLQGKIVNGADGKTPMSQGNIVTANQYLWGKNVVVQAKLNEKWEYSFNLYPGVKATIGLKSPSFGDFYLGQKGVTTQTIAAEDLTGTSVTKNLTAFVGYNANQLLLSYKLSEATRDDAVTVKYLNMLGELGAKVSYGFKGLTPRTQWGINPVLSYKADKLALPDTLTFGGITAAVKISGDKVITGEKEVALNNENNGLLEMDVTPRSGFIVNAKTDGDSYGTSYEVDWYDANNQFVGTSHFGWVNNTARELTCTFPTDVNTGTYTAVFVPVDLEQGIRLDESMVKRQVTLAPGGAVDLGDLTLPASITDSAKYVTQPNSGATVPKSYSTNDSLIKVTGTIGLDKGVSDGVLKELTWKLDNATLRNAVINGKTYSVTPGEIQAPLGTVGKYVLSDLSYQTPCSFTLYITPTDLTKDVGLWMGATVSYVDSQGKAQEKTGQQIIGQTAISTPTVSLRANSNRVSSKTVSLNGTGPENTVVTIRDNGTEIGTANVNYQGKWNAQFELSGTQTYTPTYHELIAVAEDGSISEGFGITHQEGGAALKSQGFWYGSNPKTMGYHESGDYYMWEPSWYWPEACTVFQAQFDNADELVADYSKDFIEGTSAPVVFVVEYMSGDAAYYAGTDQGGGVYKSAVYYQRSDDFASAVKSVNVLYKNKTTGLAVPEDVQAVRDTLPSAEQTNFVKYSDVSSEFESTKEVMDTVGNSDNETVQNNVIKSAAKDNIDVSFYDNMTFEPGYNTMDGFVTTKAWFDSVTSPEKGIKTITMNRYLTMEQFKACLGDGTGFIRDDIMDGTTLKAVCYTSIYQTDYKCGRMVYTLQYGTTGGDVSEQYKDVYNGYTDNGKNPLIAETSFIGAVQGGETETLSTQAEFNPSNTNGRIDYTQQRYNDFTHGFEQGVTNAQNTWRNIQNLWNNEYVGLGRDVGLGLIDFGPEWGQFMGYLSAVQTSANMMDYYKKFSEILDSLNKLKNSPCLYKAMMYSQNKDIQNAANAYYARLEQTIKDIEGCNTFNWANNGTQILAGAGLTAATMPNILSGAAGGATAVVGFCTNMHSETNYYIAQAKFNDKLMEAWVLFDHYGRAAGDKECKGAALRGWINNVNYQVAVDPSGYVYEAVASNRVEGATVTLYEEQNGAPVAVENQSDTIGGEYNPLTTTSAGTYAWGVPQGNWMVKVVKAGYADADSQNDPEATNTTTAGGVTYKWLPVLPPQTEVNIGLVSEEAPVVEKVTARPDGITVVFSKYMDETHLTADNFSLITADGKEVKIGLEKLDSEASPTKDGVNYTKTVRLTSADLKAGVQYNLKINGVLQSYAGVTMINNDERQINVSDYTPIATPKASVAGGEVTPGTAVSLSCDTQGASIYYTLDGSEPTAQTGLLYGQTPITIDGALTLKAIAVKEGEKDSAVLSVVYTMKGIAPSITTPAIAGGAVGEAFTRQIKAAGDDPITFTLTKGTLPKGVSLDNTTGIISGKPEESGHFAISITAQNATGSAVKTYEFDVTYGTLERITVTGAKTTYVEGQPFDTAGMVVTAHYTNGNTREVKEYTVSPTGALKAADKSVTISTTENGVTVTAEQAVTVTRAIAANITGGALQEPDKVLETGKDYTNTLVPDSGKKLPETITITLGDKTLTAGTDYTYDKATGNFTIFGKYITDPMTAALTLTAVCPDSEKPSVSPSPGTSATGTTATGTTATGTLANDRNNSSNNKTGINAENDVLPIAGGLVVIALGIMVAVHVRRKQK